MRGVIPRFQQLTISGPWQSESITDKIAENNAVLMTQT